MNERTTQLLKIAIRDRLERGDICDRCDTPLGNEPRRRIVESNVPQPGEKIDFVFLIEHLRCG